MAAESATSEAGAGAASGAASAGAAADSASLVVSVTVAASTVSHKLNLRRKPRLEAQGALLHLRKVGSALGG